VLFGALLGALLVELLGAGRGKLRGAAVRAGLGVDGAARVLALPVRSAEPLVGAARAGDVARLGAVLAGAAALVLSGAGAGRVFALPVRSAVRARVIASEIDSRDACSDARPRASASPIGSRDVGAVDRACLVSASNCSNHRSCQLGSVRRRSAPPVVGRDWITLNPFACRTDSGMYPDPVSMPSPPPVRVEPGYPAS